MLIAFIPSRAREEAVPFHPLQTAPSYEAGFATVGTDRFNLLSELPRGPMPTWLMRGTIQLLRDDAYSNGRAVAQGADQAVVTLDRSSVDIFFIFKTLFSVFAPQRCEFDSVAGIVTQLG